MTPFEYIGLYLLVGFVITALLSEVRGRRRGRGLEPEAYLRFSVLWPYALLSFAIVGLAQLIQWGLE